MSEHGYSFDRAQRAYDNAESPDYWNDDLDDYLVQSRIEDPDMFHDESINFSDTMLETGADILHLIASGELIMQPNGMYYVEDDLIKKIQQYQRMIWDHFYEKAINSDQGAA
jgi:hypothetical protein